MGRMNGKFALITGGTSGIGLETARQFVAEGAMVAMTGRNDDALKAAVESLSPAVIAIRSNAGVPADQIALAAELQARWGRLDVLYANAGDVTHMPLDSWDEVAFDRVMGTNLKGPFFLIQALLPILSPTASIVLCGSVSAHIGLAQSSIYAASKAALLSLARTLSAELIDRGIRVNVLNPGPTRTPALAKLGLLEPERQALQSEIERLVPLGRMGTPIEIAKAAVFLASDEASFIIGTELLVDGGTGNL
ncbi:SDR family oxidoreductase [Sphingomonas sp. GB1N7]|uniref:SDR family oxidoreductase n=1 Tax=Parasphingomonas caseinilytica TaxID=3096158 RepID=UPI002FC69A5D